MINAEALHRAADRIGSEASTPEMDALAQAGAQFLRESNLKDEDGQVVFLDVFQAIGYGVMLGYLAAQEGNV